MSGGTGRRERGPVLIVDAANVVGSRPDGWWRDRAGAAGRLVAAVRAAVDAGRLDEELPVVLVLEGAARAGAAEEASGPVRVVHAPGEGDETILSLAAGAAPPGGATVVSADRALVARARSVGADVAGPRWLLDRLSP